MRRTVPGQVVLALTILAPAVIARGEAEFTQEFRLEDCHFSDEGRNAYFSLEPGNRIVLKGEDDGKPLVVQITVLEDVESISFRTHAGQTVAVRARVVEERESVGGELAEVSRNFFARCTETNDILYFGEEVDLYHDGAITGHEGAWRAGLSGALPGLMMPGSFLIGSRYFQEHAPGVALDRAENVAQGLTITVPAGTFPDCVKVLETSPLDRGGPSTKVYCAGIGLVVDDGARLAAP